MRIEKRVLAALAVAGLLAGCGSTSRPAADNQPSAPAGKPGPGVTDTTIRIGVLDAAEPAGSGVKGSSVGPAGKQARAMIDAINARGGVAGRKLEPVNQSFSAATAEATVAQAACAKFTRETPVFAVISPGNEASDVLRRCLGKAGALHLEGVIGFDDETLKESPTFYPFAGYSMTRKVDDMIDQLHDDGWFGNSPKIALVTRDTPVYERATPRIKDALARHGHALAATFAVDLGSESTITAGVSGAVLQAKQNKITHVLFNVDAGLPFGLFASVAGSQGYRPRLGISSYEFPVIVAQNVPDHSVFVGLGGWGFDPYADVSPRQQPPPAAGEKPCLDTFRASGLAAKDDNEKGIQLLTCDGYRFFEAVANAAGATLNADTFAAALPTAKLPEPASRTKWNFSNGRDGVAVGGVVSYDKGCDCFAYRNYPRDVPR